MADAKPKTTLAYFIGTSFIGFKKGLIGGVKFGQKYGSKMFQFSLEVY